MIKTSDVRAVVEDYLKGKEGYFVAEVSVSKDNDILVEADSPKGFTIDECEELNRLIESKFDREVEDYSLEVGSPNLSSPFKVTEQYFKFQGKEVEVLDKTGKKHKGILADPTTEGFSLEETKKVKPEGAKRKVEVTEKLSFKYDEIKYTKYIIRF